MSKKYRAHIPLNFKDITLLNRDFKYSRILGIIDDWKKCVTVEDLMQIIAKKYICKERRKDFCITVDGYALYPSEKCKVLYNLDSIDISPTSNSLVVRSKPKKGNALKSNELLSAEKKISTNTFNSLDMSSSLKRKVVEELFYEGDGLDSFEMNIPPKKVQVPLKDRCVIRSKVKSIDNSCSELPLLRNHVEATTENFVLNSEIASLGVTIDDVLSPFASPTLHRSPFNSPQLLSNVLLNQSYSDAHERFSYSYSFIDNLPVMTLFPIKLMKGDIVAIRVLHLDEISCQPVVSSYFHVGVICDSRDSNQIEEGFSWFNVKNVGKGGDDIIELNEVNDSLRFSVCWNDIAELRIVKSKYYLNNGENLSVIASSKEDLINNKVADEALTSLDGEIWSLLSAKRESLTSV